MPVCNLSDLPHCVKPGTCLLGLDPGSVVLGVAIADPSGKVASPLVGIPRKKLAATLEALTRIVQERQVGGIVVGLPKNMDGTEGPAAQSARTFVSHFRKAGAPLADLPVVFWDERLSTAAVTRFMLEDDMSRRRRDETVDKAAAAYILQGALDALQKLKENT